MDNRKLIEALEGNQWELAHEIVQENDTKLASAVHAYLHRVEGDLGNARYWYAKAGRVFPQDLSLDSERARLVAELAS